MKAGLIVSDKDGEVEEVPGAFLPPNSALLGAWCRVERKDKVPTYISLGLNEYKKDNTFWKTMPATMIRKCAITQALDEAFPGHMAGLSGDQEFELATDDETVEREARVIDPAAAGSTPEVNDLHGTEDLFTNDPHRTQEKTPETPKADNEWENLGSGGEMPISEGPGVDTETGEILTDDIPRNVATVTELMHVIDITGWGVQRFETDVLRGRRLSDVLKNRTIQQVYQAFKEALKEA